MNKKKALSYIAIAGAVLFFLVLNEDLNIYKPIEFTSTGSTAFYPVYKGAVHIHTTRSDGSGTIGEIAASAKNTDIDFIVISDHDAGPIAIEDAGYHEGILVLAGSEVSLPQAHILYLPHPDSVFYNLNYVRSNILELKNSAFIAGAHPFLPKRPVLDGIEFFLDGIEFVNADVQWRKVSKFKLIEALVASIFCDHSMNLILHYPEESMTMWNRLLTLRDEKSVILGSVDAHANIEITDSWSINFPSYESVFKLLQTNVVVTEEFNGDYSHDAKLVYNALKNGNSYISFGAFGSTDSFSFSVETEDSIYTIGDNLNAAADPVLKVSIPCDTQMKINLKSQNGVVKTVEDTGYLEHRITVPGKYYIEVFLMRNSSFRKDHVLLPWIITNIISVN
ncbi:hypothetical protein ACFL7D_05410 [candidate division KSB1 bacterium]